MKPIPGYPGYKLDDKDNLWSTRRGKPIKLTLHQPKKIFTLSVNGVVYTQTLNQIKESIYKVHIPRVWELLSVPLPNYPGYGLDVTNNVWSFKREIPIMLKPYVPPAVFTLKVNGLEYKKTLLQLKQAIIDEVHHEQ